MDAMVVELRYQGIVVGRAARAPDPSVDGTFVETDAPMPVGSFVTLTPEGGPGLRVRVARVAETGAPRGMTVNWAGLDDAARAWLAQGLGAQPVDLETAVAGRRDNAATERLAVVPGAVTEEVAPSDEISAPIDVGGPPEANGGGEGGKKRKRKRR
jgi:hypothetical protein